MNYNKENEIAENGDDMIIDELFDVASVAAELRSLKPNRLHLKRQKFKQLYPIIVEMLEKHITQKSILAILAKRDLKLHPAVFKEWMAAEAMESNGNTGTALEVVE